MHESKITLNRVRAGLVLAAVVCTVATPGVTCAQTARSGGAGGGAVNAQMAQQMQQLASERTELQAQVAKLQADLEAAKKDRDALKNAKDVADKRSQSTEAVVREAQQSIAASKDAAAKDVARWKDQADQVVAKYRELAQTMQGIETESTDLKQQLAAREQAVKSCTEHNQALYDLNVEALDHLEHQGAWSSIASKEPFTRIGRARLENIAVEGRERARAEHIATPAAAPTPAPAGKN